ncbi:OmpA family protein [Chryseosolibacter indicus]|nr:OmpA family protein [Chryseosolibacter indicus]
MGRVQKLSYREVTNTRMKGGRLRQVVVFVLSIVIGILLSVSVNAQHVYHKQKARFYKSKFKKQINHYTRACSILEQKRTNKSNNTVRSSSTNNQGKHLVDETIIPKAKPTTVAKVKDRPSEKTLNKLHDQEDKVLKENKLPAPTSKEHEIIREMVAQKLKEKKDNEPIELAPLYFNFDQDEFSVVDMNPFLIAVEYALQGRTILIEGHTDSNGGSDYNVKLSIKRVQKIRDLMHDMGVPDERISVVGYGEEIAQHANNTSQGRQLNRRVDFKAF